ncbi:MAG: hypothetical protein IH962_01185 [Chloroflexi bacterium]|nr:hypothetical protein [Chloroflexota bacterium]
MAEGLAPVRAWELTQGGDAVVVDLGTPGDFADNHPAGAISLPFSDKGLVERLSSVLLAGTPVVMLATSPELEDKASAQFADSRFPLLGVIVGGIAAWQKAGLPVESLAQVPVDELSNLTSSKDAVVLVVLDVREPMEWETGHVPGAMLIPLGRLRQHLKEIPQPARVAVICEAGVRSSTAASILQAQGFPDVANVLDGTGGYRRAGLPLQFPKDSPQGGNISS